MYLMGGYRTNPDWITSMLRARPKDHAFLICPFTCPLDIFLSALVSFLFMSLLGVFPTQPFLLLASDHLLQ
jgi:hypothetical protein